MFTGTFVGCLSAELNQHVGPLGIIGVLCDSGRGEKEKRVPMPEGPQKPHFLWICHRHGFTPDHFVNEGVEKDDLTRLANSVNEKVGEIGKVSLSEVEQKLQQLAGLVR